MSAINTVLISFDPAKSKRNEAERGIPLALAEHFERNNALIEEDLRKDYGERRYQALCQISLRVHAMVFAPRAGKVHVISLRKANHREVIRYAQNT